MADTAVTDLTAATTPLTGTETFYVVQSGADRKATMADVLDYIGVIVDQGGEGTVTSVNGQEPTAGAVTVTASQITVQATAVNVSPASSSINAWLTAIDDALDAPVLNSDNLSGLTDKAAARINLGVSLPPPQGRLTLTAGVPVTSADVTAATSIYYSPLIGQLVPIYSGSEWVVKSILSSTTDTTGLTLALNSNSGHTGYHASGSLFDLFAAVVSGTLYFGTGPAWTSTTARGSGAGTTELEMFSGVWTNKNSMTLRHGTASGDTVTVPARQGTYLGSFYASANGQTAMSLKPAAAAGGSGPTAYLWNAWNQVPIHITCRDSTDTWTYQTASYRSANNSSLNRVRFVRGLGAGAISARYQTQVKWTSSTSAAIGIGYDSTTAIADGCVTGITDVNGSSVVDALPLQAFLQFNTADIGFHYLQALEWANTPAQVTFFGDNGFPDIIQQGLVATVYG